MKKILACLLILCMLSLIFCACLDNNNYNNTDDGTANSDATNVETEDKGFFDKIGDIIQDIINPDSNESDDTESDTESGTTETTGSNSNDGDSYTKEY